MSQADLKTYLRKAKFPQCAKEVLQRLDGIVTNRTKQAFAMQLISEFVFLEKAKEDVRGRPQLQTVETQLTLIQEFQLIVAIIEYFNLPGTIDVTRNAVFLSLFGSNLTNKRRIDTLCRLVSSAVTFQSTAVLESVGVWMQQVGCTTRPCLQVAENLIEDFVKLAFKMSDNFRDLPLTVSHFAANFMTAVTELYFNEQYGTLIAPPDRLLDVIASWVSENHNLCYASNQQIALPQGAIAMPVVTSIAGLLRWTILAPMVKDEITYKKLHLSLIECIINNNGSKQARAIDAKHVQVIITSLHTLESRLVKEEKLPEKDGAFKVCIERLSQAIHAAINAQAIYGNIPQLLCSLKTLPNNEFLSAIIKMHNIAI